MEIVQASSSDLVEVLFLLRACVSDMNHRGLKHWNSAFPSNDDIIADLENGRLYLCKELGVAKGMITLSDEQPEEYKKVEWKGDQSKVLYALRLAVHPYWTESDIDIRLMEHTMMYAKQNNYSAVRMDMFSGMNLDKTISDQGFVETGEFHTKHQETPYKCYEKSL